MTDTYTDINEIKQLYTKNQIYYYAKSYGLNVTKAMTKQKLCEILSS